MADVYDVYDEDDNGISFDGLLGRSGNGEGDGHRDVNGAHGSASGSDGNAPVRDGRGAGSGDDGERRVRMSPRGSDGGSRPYGDVGTHGHGVDEHTGVNAVGEGGSRPVRRYGGVSSGGAVAGGGGDAGVRPNDVGGERHVGAPVASPVVRHPSVRRDLGSANGDGGRVGSPSVSAGVRHPLVHPDVPVRRVVDTVDDTVDTVDANDGNAHHREDGVRSDDGERHTRGKDRHKRATRSRIGDVDLSKQQARIVDRVNRNRRGDAKAFVMTDTDQRVFDYLVRWRFATRLDVLRVGGWRGFYGRKSYRLNEYRDLGFVNVDRIPLERLTYAQLTSTGVALSKYDYLGAEPATVITSGTRSHSLGLSSLASQLLAVDEEYDDAKYDLLGLGDGWGELRRDIRNGDAKVIAEREYRSALSRVRKGMASPSAITDAKVSGAMMKMFRDELRDGNGSFCHDLYDWFCCDPQYGGAYAWLWTVFGNWVVRDVEKNKYGRPLLIDVHKERALDDRGKPVLIPGDRFATKDHLPDMIIARHRNRNGSPNSIAIELELTAKSEEDYDQTMCGFMSNTGKILYRQVIWLVVQGATANLIRRGATKAGAVEGVDYRIVAVSSSDTRSSFYNGADMRPGVIDVYDSGEARGYSRISEIMDSSESGR